MFIIVSLFMVVVVKKQYNTANPNIFRTLKYVYNIYRLLLTFKVASVKLSSVIFLITRQLDSCNSSFI